MNILHEKYIYIIKYISNLPKLVNLSLKVIIITGIVTGGGVVVSEVVEKAKKTHNNPDVVNIPTHLPSPLYSAIPTPKSTQTNFIIPSPTSNQQKPITSLKFVYNVQQLPPLTQSPELQTFVNQLVDLITEKNLPTQSLSIQLIDLKTNQQAGYQSQEFRFPASISKLFWLVALYAWIDTGLLSSDYELYDLNSCKTDICKMTQKSDNNAASRILDLLTGTTSGQTLDGESYEIWLDRRKTINQFFQEAGYEGIRVNQKNFPIPDLNIQSPEGSDLKMRGDLNNPIRNRITAYQSARLMYEIFTSQAVSPKASEQMVKLLTRYDLSTGAWKSVEYNPIKGFLGESLPTDTYFASKVGWTSDSRQEVAYVATQDGKSAYILAILADGSSYGNDWEIFPEISQLLFRQMNSR